MTLSRLPVRLRRSIAQRGVAGTARLAFTSSAVLARKAFLLDESHVWYSLDLPLAGGGGRDDGLLLVAVGADAVMLLLDVPFPTETSAVEALRRGGAAGWALQDGDSTVFSCWTFSSRVPAIHASGGWLTLPANTHFLENSVAAPGQRGRGLAAAAWSAVARRLAADGVAALMTKVEVGNMPARKAVERFGFSEVARTRLRRTGGLRRVQVDVCDDRYIWLASALRR